MIPLYIGVGVGYIVVEVFRHKRWCMQAHIFLSFLHVYI